MFRPLAAEWTMARVPDLVKQEVWRRRLSRFEPGEVAGRSPTWPFTREFPIQGRSVTSSASSLLKRGDDHNVNPLTRRRD